MAYFVENFRWRWQSPEGTTASRNRVTSLSVVASTVVGHCAYTFDVDELLAAVLAAIAEFLLEAFLELIAAAILDLVSRILAGVFKTVAEATNEDQVLAGLMYALLGVLAGALSIMVLPHPLIRREHPIRLHGISLLISPIIAGLVMSAVGRILRRRGKKVAPVESFGFGFLFALGMAFIRLLFAK